MKESLLNIIEKEMINEVTYGKFKKDVKHRTKSEQLHKAIREVKRKLAGGVAVLYIGAPTETEMKEKKDRVDDALAATRAAVEEGIVPGGGVALIRCSNALNDLSKDLNPGEALGVSIVRNALSMPLYQIVTNAGGNGDVIAHFVKEGKDAYGYNARTDEYGDMIVMGIIDPTKVTRTAVENAVSIASMILMTECIIVDEPSKDDLPGDPGMMM